MQCKPFYSLNYRISNKPPFCNPLSLLPQTFIQDIGGFMAKSHHPPWKSLMKRTDNINDYDITNRPFLRTIGITRLLGDIYGDKTDC